MQYPGMIPDLELRDTKGLDDKRHAKFLCDLHAKLRQFSPGPMLVAISEAAKELLTSMNAPDGDCCFCMLPLDMPDSMIASAGGGHGYCNQGNWRTIADCNH
jgi:hypothetical protein